MSGLVGSRIVRSLLPPLLSTGTTATIICAYESMLRVSVLCRVCRGVRWRCD